MNEEIVRETIAKMRPVDVVRQAEKLGHDIKRQNVEYFQRHPASKPNFRAWAAMEAVAQDKIANEEGEQ